MRTVYTFYGKKNVLVFLRVVVIIVRAHTKVDKILGSLLEHLISNYKKRQSGAKSAIFNQKLLV